MLSYEWDDNKAQINLAKHGVSFKEAATVFDDVYARVIADPDHSLDEERFIILGLSAHTRELVVCHCLRGVDASIVRIISARKATKTETKQFWRYVDA
ncbi:MAG: BrnT family toxin [Atopobiaceae bacterium]|nr:BrnT family toxin [Atopobiaceae bacterium]